MGGSNTKDSIDREERIERRKEWALTPSEFIDNITRIGGNIIWDLLEREDLMVASRISRKTFSIIAVYLENSYYYKFQKALPIFFLPHKIKISDEAPLPNNPGKFFSGVTHFKLDSQFPDFSLPSSLTHLTIILFFGHTITFPPSLVYLNLVKCELVIGRYDRIKKQDKLEEIFHSLPPSLTHLELGIGFEGIIPAELPSLSSLSHLTLLDCTSPTLPPSIIFLKIRGTLNSTHFFFPPSLISLDINICTTQLKNIPNSVQHIRIQRLKLFLNTEVECLPPNLISLDIDTSPARNDMYQILPRTLTKLILPSSFNEPIKNLPQSLKYLEFARDSLFNHSIDCLPNSITYLSLPNNFNQPVHSFPSSLQTLLFGFSFKQPLIHLPSSLLLLSLSSSFNHPLANLPEKLVNLKIFRHYTFPLENLPPITHLRLHSFDHPLSLPPTLEYFYFSSSSSTDPYKYPLILPPKLTDFTLFYKLQTPLSSLPTTLTYLSVGVENEPMPPLPKGLHTLILPNYNFELSLPPSLKKLQIRSYSRALDFPPNLKYLSLQSTYPHRIPQSEFLTVNLD